MTRGPREPTPEDLATYEAYCSGATYAEIARRLSRPSEGVRRTVARVQDYRRLERLRARGAA